MKLLLKITLALIAFSIISNAMPSPFASWAQDVAYESCTDLRADWPTGVARSEKSARGISAAGKAKPRVHAGTYTLNASLDSNNDGVMCADKKTHAVIFDEALRESTR